ncbi:MAG: hypothetical protein V3U26_08345 [Dehalococcoidia bacterium]
MITNRRIYQGKPGTAVTIVAMLKEYQELASKLVERPPYRIYTDCLSGHTDRVVLELDIESLGALEKGYQAIANVPEYQQYYKKWKKDFMPLIEGATVEFWTREV